jgi:hypothetical protein
MVSRTVALQSVVVLALCATLGACKGTDGFKGSNKGVDAKAPGAGSEAGSADGQVGGEGQSADGSNGAVDALLQACDNGSLKDHAFSIVYPARKGCTWDKGTKNAYMAAHFEEKKSLSVPSNWVVCSMSIGAPRKEIYYDDYIMLHFNNKLLIGSGGIIDLLDKDPQGLPVYDWSKLSLKSHPKGGSTCVAGATKCSLPATQTKGAFELEMDDGLNRKLMALALSASRFEFGLVTTGDNDQSIDCAHSELPLTVSVKYYVK